MIRIYSQFVQEDHCDKIIRQIEGSLHPATQIWKDDKGTIMKRVGTKRFVYSSAFVVLKEVFDDICTLCDRPRSELDAIQLFRYGVGDSYPTHRDAKAVSCLIYLNNVECGGETYFPDDQVLIKPSVGTFVTFNNDERHESLPVTKGEKYIMAFWFEVK